MRTHALLRAAVSIAVSMAALQAAYPMEGIRSFTAVYSIDSMGIVTATDSIVVHAEGIKIRHGIFRDIETTHHNPWGVKRNEEFRLISVRRDGHAEKHWTEEFPRGVRLYIGDEDRLLPRGDHDYQMVYQIKGAIRETVDGQECLIDVTGRNWDFPIDSVLVQVKPPGNIRRDQVEMTGLLHSNWWLSHYHDVHGARSENGAFRIEWIGLDPGVGFSIKLRFPMETFPLEPRNDRLNDFMTTNKGLVAGLSGVVALFLYYAISWWWVGRDPVVESARPSRRPPDGISPAMARFLSNLHYDHRCLHAAISSMATKGFLKIRPYGDTFKFEKTGIDKGVLSKDEKIVADNLFGSKSETIATQKHFNRFSKASTWLKEYLEEETYQFFITENRKYLEAGWILSLAVSTMVLFMEYQGRDFFASFLLSIGLFILARFIFSKGRMAWLRKAFGPDRRRGLSMIASIAETVVVPLFLGSLLLLVTAPVGLWFTLLVFGLFILNPIFGILLRQPTLEGKRLLNEIHSFKSFLREEARRTEGRRDRSPEEGDTLFPYAVAFGFSSDWLRAFQHQISKMESFGGIDRAFFQNSS
ncbi:MAG: DUF2207 domain-containing protein, partial [Candidatus Omnitrophica bacterium]|nr:DUF2207 domain-containing protein [Candidatus Omnitrophota bacterium]